MEKKIPLKKYVILFFVFAITVFAVFYVRNWYIMTKVYSDVSPLLDVVSEINSNEINNYVMENQNFVIYVSSNSNDKVKGFEKSFSRYIIDKGISNSILYINRDSASESLANQLSIYANSMALKNKIDIDRVSIYVFENGEIKKIILDADKVGLKKIDKMFKEYGMIDNA